MSLTVHTINTENRRDVDRFMDVHTRLYRNTPQWVPPLADDARLMLNRRKYPYYAHSEAAFFVAECDGRDVGRIAMLDNVHYNHHWGSKTAFFYLFDCEDDPLASAVLFNAAEAWAKQRGLNKIVGAKGFLQGDGIGVLVEGFEHHPAVGIPYNHAYYGKLIEGSGYTKQRDFMSAYMPGNANLPQRVFEIANKMKKQRGFWIKTFANKRELSAWVPQIVQCYNDTFINNWEYNPITLEEGKVIGERLMSIADPKLIKLVMKSTSTGDVIAGFLFGFPDISDGIRKAGGKLWPFGFIHILRDFGKTRWLNLNGAGILAPYRGLGVNAILYAEMFKSLQQGKFEHADIVQMEESVLTLDDTLRLGGRVYKKHRIYEKTLSF